MTSAMLLAAGLGTRLRPLSDEVPKPLLPVGDRPVLAHVLERLRGAGVARFVVNAFHLAEQVERFVDEVEAAAREPGAVLGEGTGWADDPAPRAPIAIHVSRERDLLGTAGGVAAAGRLLGDGDVVVWNGDILAEIDVGALLAAHAAHAGAGVGGTLVVRPAAAGAGNVGLDAEGRIVRLRQEATGVGEVRGAEFLGVHALAPRVRALLPARGCLVGDVYLPWLRRGGLLRTIDYAGPFWDIGTLASYLDANLAWLGSARAWCASSATVGAGVTLNRAIVGAGARIEGEGALDEVVVWPGARAAAPRRRAIVTPRDVVDVA